MRLDNSAHRVGVCSTTLSRNASLLHPRLSGLHARSETLVQLTREFDRNRVEWGQVVEQLRGETVELVKLQQKLGCQYLSDGSLSWKDQLRPVLQCLSGLAGTTRYSRWYDTNTFYQKPIVVAPVKFKDFQPNLFFETNVLPKNAKWTVTIPGPWTLSELSEDKYYNSGSLLLEDYTQALQQVIDRLAQSGVKHVQLSEPSLVYWPYRQDPPNRQELDEAINAIRRLVERGRVEFSIHTFFGDATSIISDLWKLPVEAVSFDLYETDWEKLPENQKGPSTILGIVDSEESGVETPEWIAKTARAVGKRIGNNVEIAPNTDLKFVPRIIADQKLEALGLASEILAKEVVS